VRLQQGIGAMAGVIAVVLAQIGYTGPKNVLQGTYGFYPLYGRNDYDPDKITSKLGKYFEIVNLSIKPYPSGKHTHIPISIVLDLVKEYYIKPNSISRIIVRTNQAGYNKCGSGPNKRHPRTIEDIQFSIPFTVAMAIVKGDVSLGDFTKETLEDTSMHNLAAKVEVKVDADLDRMPVLNAPMIIEPETKDGRQFSRRADFVKGHPDNPMSLTDCIEKFRNCTRFSAKQIKQEGISEFVDAVSNLEDVDNVQTIVKSLVEKGGL
jgi:2-methylcitrate dehydratase PrpD